MSSSSEALVSILEEVKGLLSRNGNDFSWSSWKSKTDAYAEIDGLITRIHSSQPGDSIDYRIIFAATGPLQEVSISSGWGYEFLQLSARADKAIEQYFSSLN